MMNELALFAGVERESSFTLEGNRQRPSPCPNPLGLGSAGV